MLSALRRLFAPKDSPSLRSCQQEIRELAAQLKELQLAESERERVLAEQLQRLTNFWKRIRQREAYERDDPTPGGKLDPATTRAVLALKLRNGS